MKSFLCIPTLVAAIAVLPLPAAASYIYTYTGLPFTSFGGTETTRPNPYDNSMSITISLEVETPLLPNRPIGPDVLVPLDASFSDGTVTIDRSNASGFILGIATDDSGAISAWDLFAATSAAVALDETFHTIYSSFGPGIDFANSDYARTSYCVEQTPRGTCIGDNFHEAISEPPGSWSVSQVPLPPAIWLFGSALAGLALRAKRKSR